jgi:hypothetical protein
LLLPEKVSLLCRDDDSFLRFLLPEPARYVTSAKAFASRIARQLNQLFETGRLAERHVSVLPEFSRGETLRQC